MGNHLGLENFPETRVGFYDLEKIAKQGEYRVRHMFKSAEILKITDTFHTNMRDVAKGFTLLHYAVYFNDKKLVKYLLEERSADTTIIPNKRHFSVFNLVNPLVFAVENNNYEISKMVIEASERFYTCSEMINFHHPEYKSNGNLLTIAFEKPDFNEKLILLLIKHGCNVNHKDSGGNGILAQNKNKLSLFSLDVYKALFNAGFDFNDLDGQHCTIFHYDKIFENDDICEFLIKNKCVDLNTPKGDHRGWDLITVFGVSCHGKRPGRLVDGRLEKSIASEKICKLMLDYGANPFNGPIPAIQQAGIPALKLIEKIYSSEKDYNDIMQAKFLLSLPDPSLVPVLVNVDIPTPTAPLVSEEKESPQKPITVSTMQKPIVVPANKKTRECIVCFESMNSSSSSSSSSCSYIVVTAPCGHAVMCSSCASRIKLCPKCRVSIQNSFRLFLED